MNLRPGAWSCVVWGCLACCLATGEAVAQGERPHRSWPTAAATPFSYLEGSAEADLTAPDAVSSSEPWLVSGAEPVLPVEGGLLASEWLPGEAAANGTVEEWLSNHFLPQAGDEFQFLPTGLMYRSYLAGPKESRLASSWMVDGDGRLVWETSLGARVGLFRVGTDDLLRPEGWQLDLEGAAMPRVLPQEDSSPLEATDFRVGLMSTWRRGDWAFKTGYNHLSAHAGDEFLIRHPGFQRLNYVRDSILTGAIYDLTESIQTYSEIGVAINAEDGARPLEFQYGVQYSPYLPNGLRGSPFLAVNGQTRQDADWITGTNVMAGWQWRGDRSPSLWRVGLQYYTGPAYQWEFVGRQESLLGGGLWFDF